MNCEFIIFLGIQIFVDFVDSIKPLNYEFNEY